MADYYSYTLENLEDSGSFYTFYSDENKRLYSVSFDTYLYQEFLDDFPYLLGKGCALGFYNQPTQPGFKKKFDSSVCPTIVEIIYHYLSSQGADCVLLYHCDMDDNRQYCRHLLFDKWYEQQNLKDKLIKETLEVAVPLQEGVKMYYLGYIAPINNPNIENIRKEFDAFSYNMASFEHTKNHG